MNIASTLRNWIKPAPSMSILFVEENEHDKELSAQLDQASMELSEIGEKLRQEIDRRHYSEYRAIALAEAASSAILIHRDWKVLVANRKFEELTGLKESSLMDDPELIWGMFLEPSREDIKTKIKTGDMSPYEAKIKSTSGEVYRVWIDPIMVPYNGHGLCRAARIHKWEDRNAGQ